LIHQRGEHSNLDPFGKLVTASWESHDQSVVQVDIARHSLALSSKPAAIGQAIRAELRHIIFTKST